MHGFLNVNKPQGITSFEVVKRVRKYFPRQKVGHLGTLDPMAEGVLPLAVGRATRLVEFLMDVAKGYRAEMVLGGVSDTQDAWGNITLIAKELSFTLSDVEKVLELFRGEILQVPPMYSAVNYRGRRLYELARKGVEVSVEARPVTIYSLRVVQAELREPPFRVILDVVCSKGTYVRTLCHDIGQKLGCGAYLSKLVRVFSGPFLLEHAVGLAEMEERLGAGDYSLLLPLDFPLSSMPKVVLENEDDVIRVRNGNTINIEGDLASGPVLIYTSYHDLVAVGYPVQTKRDGTALKPVKVLGNQ